MELPQRQGNDRFLPQGYYHSLQNRLHLNTSLAEVRSLVISAFDRSTRMFPFVNFDWYTLPCGPRSIAAALHEAGMKKTRFVYQLWNPRLKPSQARIDSAPIDMLMISSMQVHAAEAYKLVEEAWRMGDARPLIIAGGPKAIYEPFDYFGLGHNGQFGADVVVTGEEPVLLELLAVLTDFGGTHGTMRAAFERARQAGALNDIPGLVFSRDGRHDGMNLINTGIQRMLQDLDELPLTSVGYRMLEAPHRKQTLAPAPLPIDKVGGGSMVTTVLITRGCKYNCHYCPIPAYNQKSYRHKSPQRVAEEFADCHEQMNTKYIFGADDNFFNSRRYAEETLEALATKQVRGKALGRRIRFGTECTVADAYKMRDLFPIAQRGHAGLSGLWMGVEDLSGHLVDKGQNPGITEALFEEMWKYDISPMIMMMHSDDQPLRSPGKLDGLINQMHFLFRAGAVGAQCTVVNPAVGSRWLTDVYKDGLLFDSVAGRTVKDADFDGNHVIASTRPDPWRVQLNMLRGYAAFYNPLNLLRILKDENKYLREKRAFYQVWGMAALARTAWMLRGHFWRLATGKIKRVKDWPTKFRRPGSPYPELIPSEPEPAQKSSV
jgi:radical SAM superfamily enzyme YgiQ (UPF0313 family)